jgi:hypothetical protein
LGHCVQIKGSSRLKFGLFDLKPVESFNSVHFSLGPHGNVSPRRNWAIAIPTVLTEWLHGNRHDEVLPEQGFYKQIVAIKERIVFFGDDSGEFGVCIAARHAIDWKLLVDRELNVDLDGLAAPCAALNHARLEFTGKQKQVARTHGFQKSGDRAAKAETGVFRHVGFNIDGEPTPWVLQDVVQIEEVVPLHEPKIVPNAAAWSWG